MGEQQRDRKAPSYDVIVIGAGICGVIFLKYASEKGLRCLGLEKRDDVGGAWSWLPSWQDIQNRKEDFALNGVPLNGVTQGAVHEYVHEWVRRFDLQSSIRLGCEVTSVSWMEDRWEVHTSQGTFDARYLIAASGVQNEPNIPEVERARSEVVEIHSSQLRRPADLAGKRITVVGGGTSSWDLLEQALFNGASEIEWVYRSLRWFQPTNRTTQTLANGERFQTDVVLWATGYRMNLGYLGLPEYQGIDRVAGLSPRLGSLIRATDYPNLFFVGMTLIEGTGSTPFFAAVEAKSIVAHIRGECEIPEETVPDMIIHWALIHHFARFDHSNYSRVWWRIKYFCLAIWYQVMHNRAVRL